MYHISLYENGRFSTHIGGPTTTLPEALEQMQKIAASVQGQEVPGVIGYHFDRAGTDCALVITDEWEMPIRQAKEG